MTFEPAPGALIELAEGKTANISLSEQRAPSDPPASIDWFVDGQLTPDDNWSRVQLPFNYSSSGNHTVRVVVWRNAELVSAEWPVSVSEVNRLPYVGINHSSQLRPTLNGPYLVGTMSHGGTLAVSGQVVDPDGDPVTWVWTLDGVVLAENVDIVTISDPAVGEHVLI